MSIGEIIKVGLVDTALGMGTVFSILIFISICIWLMGMICRDKKPAAEPEIMPETSAASETEEDAGIDPEVIAVITAAIHQYMKDEDGENEEYVVRKVRRATWKHTS